MRTEILRDRLPLAYACYAWSLDESNFDIVRDSVAAGLDYDVRTAFELVHFRGLDGVLCWEFREMRSVAI